MSTGDVQQPRSQSKRPPMKKTRKIKGTASPKHPLPQESLDLIVDHSHSQPRPLDVNIAAVHLRTPSNQLSEGYDLLLSASFGRERVTLTSEDMEIDVDFSTQKANVTIHPINSTCEIIETTDGERTPETTITIKERNKKESTRTAQAGGTIGARSRELNIHGNVTGRVSESSHSKLSIEHSITRLPWHRIDQTVIIGPIGEQDLHGPLITDFKGWRITPADKQKTSGVMARVNVREDWISFKNIRVTKSPPNIASRIANILKSPNKRQCFEILLRHLAAKELGKYQTSSQEGTIAAHTLVVRPIADRATSLPAAASLTHIPIDGAIVKRYVALDGFEVGALLSLGVRDESIRRANLTDPDFKPKRRIAFVPEGSPISALSLYCVICGGKPISKEASKLSAKRDLLALGLIAHTHNATRVFRDEDFPPEIKFRRAVSQKESIRIARTILHFNPSASGTEVARAVAAELGVDWPKASTQKRNGNALRRWTVWLEPQLMDPEASSEQAALLAYAMEESVPKGGRPDSLRRLLEDKVAQLTREGLTVTQIAKMLNLSTGTIYNWRRKRKIRIEHI